MTYLTVSQVAGHLGKSEETIKRWLRSGKRFPNAFKNSDAEGWRIPATDLDGQASSLPHHEQLTTENLVDHSPQGELTELITLAYQAVTLTYPTDEIVKLLTQQGLRRSLEILMTMNQANHSNKVKSPVGFIRACIKGNWTPDTLPQKIDRRRVNLERKLGLDLNANVESFPFYNWLEQES